MAIDNKMCKIIENMIDMNREIDRIDKIDIKKKKDIDDK